MELTWYLFLSVLTIIFCIKPEIFGNQRIFFLFWILIALITSVIVRFTDIEYVLSNYRYTNDITHYSSIMLQKNIFSDGFIYLREPITYLILISLYRLAEDRMLAFIIFDLICFCFLFRGISLMIKGLAYSKIPSSNDNNKLNYVFICIFLFFPFVIGMHVTLRQYLATIFIICSLGYALNKETGRAFIFLIIAILSHNSAGLFGPIILYLTGSRFLRIVAYLGAALIPFTLSFANNLASNFGLQEMNQIDAGETIDKLYSIFFIFIFILFCISSHLKKNTKDNIFLAISGYFAYISILSNISLSSSGSERLGMFITAILLPLIVVFADEKYKHKIIIRLSIFTISVLPLMFFYKQI